MCINPHKVSRKINDSTTTTLKKLIIRKICSDTDQVMVGLFSSSFFDFFIRLPNEFARFYAIMVLHLTASFHIINFIIIYCWLKLSGLLNKSLKMIKMVGIAALIKNGK